MFVRAAGERVRLSQHLPALLSPLNCREGEFLSEDKSRIQLHDALRRIPHRGRIRRRGRGRRLLARSGSGARGKWHDRDKRVTAATMKRSFRHRRSPAKPDTGRRFARCSRSTPTRRARVFTAHRPRAGNRSLLPVRSRDHDGDSDSASRRTAKSSSRADTALESPRTSNRSRRG